MLVVCAVFTLLVPGAAQKHMTNGPECKILPPAPHKRPEPTKCPCGPTIMKQPFHDKEIVIVYEAWSGYCNLSPPWLSTSSQQPEATLPTSLGCSRAAACCLSATYFLEGEKPRVREFTSCPGNTQKLLIQENLFQQAKPSEKKKDVVDTLRPLPEVPADAGGFASIKPAKKYSACSDDIDDSVTKHSNVDGGGSVVEKIYQALKGSSSPRMT